MNFAFLKSISFYATIVLLVAFFALPFVQVNENEEKIAKVVKVKHEMHASGLDLMMDRGQFLWLDKETDEVKKEETAELARLGELTHGAHKGVAIYLLLCIPFLLVLILSDKNNAFKKITRILLPLGSIMAVAALYVANVYIDDDAALLVPGMGLWIIFIASIVIALEPLFFKSKPAAQ
jgi:hypothetical protein